MNKNIYKCKDGRVRVYDKETQKVTSYPRLLMEEKLNRKLKPNEEVHHIDGNPLNNEVSNLVVIDGREHRRQHVQKYYDKEMTCPICGKLFIWSALQQKYYHGNHPNKIDAKPTCSKTCAGKLSMKNI